MSNNLIAPSLETVASMLASIRARELVSQNLPGTDERNQALFARYRGRLRQTGA